jgi:two-component system response regulator NreC
MNIVVVEDHQLVRDMMVAVCGHVFPNSEVLGAGTGAEGVIACRALQPQVVFLDLGLPDGDGLGFVPEIAAVAPKAKIIVLTSQANEFTLWRVMRARVHGFLDGTTQPLKVLGDVISTVLEGRRFFSPSIHRMQTAMRHDPLDFSKLLSDREQEMLTWFGTGLTNEEISERIGLAVRTVKNHRLNIMNKLEIHGTPKLMRYALEKGFTRVEPLAPVVPAAK